MSESVEQAALARAERDALPAPWGSVLDALEALSRLNDGRFKLTQAINSRHDDELAEIRDGMLELGSLIESLRSLVIGVVADLREDLSLYPPEESP